MDIKTITEFFMWCTVINGSILIVWSLFVVALPDFIYRVQSKLITIPRDKFDIVMYSFVGLFKLLFIVFNVVPYLALLVIGP